MNIKNFVNSSTYRVIKCTGLIGLIVWLLTVLSFIISFEYGRFNAGWMQVGWIVPLGVLGFGLFIFACFFDLCLYVAYKEFVRKEQNISFGILNLFDKYVSNNIVIFLCLICFVITLIPAMYYIVLITPIAIVIYFLFSLVKNRN